MDTQYLCQNDKRHGLVGTSTTLNGIDYIEVTSADQKTLEVHFLHPLPGQPNGIPSSPALTTQNVLITGGTRVRDIRVESVTASAEKLAIQVNARGDFSFYTLEIVNSPQNRTAPAGFDPQLAKVDFSFKAGCPSEFDCQQVRECPAERRIEPEIDYLAKDYASFRRLMLDRMSAITPDWPERNPADAHVALVELLAYVGDHLSYYQDAVATEAYLGTARERISVRRHARLLDYFMHDGANARTWLFLEAGANNFVVKAGEAFATKGDPSNKAAGDAAIIFETMHDVRLFTAHNDIRFYTWSDTECCLPKGATRATLQNNPALSLKRGDLLLLEEVFSPTTGNPADIDLNHRHVVRLTNAVARTDVLDATAVFDIEWAEADALPFPLCLSKVIEDAKGVPRLADISLARGNIVLADHGHTITGEDLGQAPSKGPFRPILKHGPLTQKGHARDHDGLLVLDQNKRPVAFDADAPVPARGGCDPESMEEVRQYAPEAFRVQERAVTEADWAEVTQRNPEVQKAAARFRWTGSWTTVFLTIDRKGGQKVDAKFAREMRARLERYRIAGYDLEVRAPLLVPLDIFMHVCVQPGYFQSEVEKGLLAAFSNRDLPDGRRGFFHPDNFTFGQAIFLSQIYRLAMQQRGVASVEVKRFQRWGAAPNQEIDGGLLRPAALEIVQLDNDRNFPENGKLEFDVQGGL